MQKLGKKVYFCVIVKFNAQTYELTLPSRLQLLIHLFILKISKPKETKHCQLSLSLLHEDICTSVVSPDMLS